MGRARRTRLRRGPSVSRWVSEHGQGSVSWVRLGLGLVSTARARARRRAGPWTARGHAGCGTPGGLVGRKGCGPVNLGAGPSPVSWRRVMAGASPVMGLWRSPVAHLVRIEGVRGSNPLSSTRSAAATQWPPSAAVPRTAAVRHSRDSRLASSTRYASFSTRPACRSLSIVAGHAGPWVNVTVSEKTRRRATRVLSYGSLEVIDPSCRTVGRWW